MLARIAENVRHRVTQTPRADWEREINERLAVAPGVPSFRHSIEQDSERFIFEIKRQSPSDRSPIEVDVVETAMLYEECGAAAISVLTEPEYFGGGLRDLEIARQTVSVPLLRKDFVVDRLQVAEARAWGGSAVLLIVAILDDTDLQEFIECAASLSLEALVEVHTRIELARALDAGATTIGVNSRDLHTMTIDLGVAARLIEQIPDHCLRIAESGIKSRADVEMFRDSGADAFLIGSSVMRAPDRRGMIMELKGR